ncbi:MAG: SMI1/KNR4 family protein, partial [Polyangiaceae bacterium]|nr:SMI1/KNR4 family protein [Polyangiaceae bacterium]
RVVKKATQRVVKKATQRVVKKATQRVVKRATRQVIPTPLPPPWVEAEVDEGISTRPTTPPLAARQIPGTESVSPRRASDIGFAYGGLLRERPGPTPEQWARIEARVGALPEDYKAFLEIQNGGTPRLPYLPIAEDGFLVECLNYVDGAGEDIYDVERASVRPSEDLGEEVVAIAPDGSGDQLILRRVDSDWRVQWWRHDEGTTEDVAMSFSDLLDLLEADPNPESEFDEEQSRPSP